MREAAERLAPDVARVLGRNLKPDHIAEEHRRLDDDESASESDCDSEAVA